MSTKLGGLIVLFAVLFFCSCKEDEPSPEGNETPQSANESTDTDSTEESSQPNEQFGEWSDEIIKSNINTSNNTTVHGFKLTDVGSCDPLLVEAISSDAIVKTLTDSSLYSDYKIFTDNMDDNTVSADSFRLKTPPLSSINNGTCSGCISTNYASTSTEYFGTKISGEYYLIRVSEYNFTIVSNASQCNSTSIEVTYQYKTINQ